jgi:hypothetical protein
LFPARQQQFKVRLKKNYKDSREPEGYTYDDNGNLLTQTGAKGFPNVSLRIIGDDPLKAKLIEKVKYDDIKKGKLCMMK